MIRGSEEEELPPVRIEDSAGAIYVSNRYYDPKKGKAIWDDGSDVQVLTTYDMNGLIFSNGEKNE